MPPRREAIGAPVTLLSGGREAELSALGVISGINRPDGVVGDLGGGSLELIDVKGAHAGKGTSLPLGGLTLMDASRRSPRAAVKIVREALAGSRIAERLSGRTFYAVGGTWRALAKLHMGQRNYPLAVTHGYVIPARDAADFAGLVERANTETLISIDAVNAARRPLLAYGAVVLEEIIRRARPREVMISTTGVREGLLYEMLDIEQRRQDPLLVAAAEFNQLFSRAPGHAGELCAWTDSFMKSMHAEETPEERRLRHAACLLADVNWRAHPDRRQRGKHEYRRERRLPRRRSSGPFVSSPSRRPIAIWDSTRTSVRRSARWFPRGCSTGRAFSPPRCAPPLSSRAPCRESCP